MNCGIIKILAISAMIYGYMSFAGSRADVRE